jgi:transposase InsO family protein
VVERIEALRRQRWTGLRIAVEVGVSPATVSRVRRRLGLNKLNALEPAEPIRRYQRERPGELIHIDIKRLGRFTRVGHRITGDRTGQSRTRGVGWARLHRRQLPRRVRPGHARRTQDQRRGFPGGSRRLLRQARHHRREGHTALAIGRSFSPRLASASASGTRPYTPKTNGKAERFIQTALREWAYAKAYQTSDQRAQQLPIWLHRYNWHRPHGSLKAKTPINRLGLSEDNLLRLHI